MVTVEVIQDLSRAEALAPVWDKLAVACSLPLCAPGWMLAWWKHIASPSYELRLLAVHEDSELLGLAPWFVQTKENGRVDLRFLGAQMSDRVDVLCSTGREREVAQTLREALRELQPRPNLVAFEAAPLSSGWTRRLSSGWSGRLRFARYLNSARPAPTVTLPAGAPEQWLANRSKNFRSQMRRMRRHLEKQGGAVRHISDPDELTSALEAMMDLHTSRWEGRGESSLKPPGVTEMLHEAAELLGPDRLRLWAAEIDGEPISVQLFLAAGTEVKYWNGGWSEEHADLKPSMLTILAALEDAISRGEHRLDLGVGAHQYKQRFADGQDMLSWGGIIMRGLRWPRTRTEFIPMILRYRGKLLIERMPASVATRVRAIAQARRGS